MQDAVNERDLLVNVKDARAKVAELEELMTEAQARVAVAEAKLIEFMTDRGVKSTAKYEGIGYASLDKPELFARCNKPDQDRLFDYLNGAGRGDLIKPSVHHRSLSGFVKELLEGGQTIPEFIQYGFVNKVKVYKDKQGG